MSTEIKQNQLIDINLLEPAEFNPNKMPDKKFNKLVERIAEQGFKDPISVVPLEDGRYRIIEGEHRWRAGKYLDMSQVPVFIHTDWDDDKQKFEIVKSNILKGEIDVEKFTKLVNGLNDKYENDILSDMMGFTDEAEFGKFYEKVRSGLPDELKDKLDAVKDEIKTIDDLSNILNRLFREYGSTLEQGFMMFDYGGKDNIWIKCNDHLWKKVVEIKNKCTAESKDINDTFIEYLK